MVDLYGADGIRALHGLVGAHGGPAGGPIGAIIREYRQAWPVDAVPDRWIAEPPHLAPGPPHAVGAAARDAAPSVGLVSVVRDGASVPMGTCFRVGRHGRLVATAGHVLSGMMRAGTIILDALPFRETGDGGQGGLLPTSVTFPATDARPALAVQVAAVRLCHGCSDLLVHELADDGQDLPPPLPLLEDPARIADRTPVVVLGYPDLDHAEGQAFASAYGPAPQPGLYVAPGLLWPKSKSLPATQAETKPSRIDPHHDASTLPGFSGGPVVSVADGTVLGLHYQGGEFARTGIEPSDRNDAVHLAVALREERLRHVMLEGGADADLPPETSFWDDEGLFPRWQPLTELRLEEAFATAAPQPLFDGVDRDRSDVRDLTYLPGLRALPDRHLPEPPPGAVVRGQGNSRACTGFALAAAIDHQLALLGRGGGPVSARMLYEAAKTQDEWLDRREGGSSLRGAIKGFSQHGVCSEAKAPWKDRSRPWRMTQEMGHDARAITLGAYFRVPSDLLAMQSAIHEAGTVVVSARLHPGWKSPRADSRRPGPGWPALRNRPLARIQPRVPDPSSAHAFVVVGYDEYGFVVQNSWGKAWGTQGFAHWSYEDWAETVIDAWVIRLAPSHARTFSLTARSAPMADPEAEVRQPRPRRYGLVGHVAQTEAEGFVPLGPLGSGPDTLRETGLFLASDEGRKKYERIVFVIHDPFLGADAVARLAGRLTPAFKAQGTYPLHLVHGLSEAETIRLRVLAEATAATRRYGHESDLLSPYIARRVAATLQAPWDRFLSGLAAAVAEGGPVWTALAAIVLEAGRGRSLQVLALGAGDRLAAALHDAGTLSALRARPRPFAFAAPTLPGEALQRMGGQILLHGPPKGARAVADIPGYKGDWYDLLVAAFGGNPPSGDPALASGPFADTLGQPEVLAGLLGRLPVRPVAPDAPAAPPGPARPAAAVAPSDGTAARSVR